MKTLLGLHPRLPLLPTGTSTVLDCMHEVLRSANDKLSYSYQACRDRDYLLYQVASSSTAAPPLTRADLGHHFDFDLTLYRQLHEHPTMPQTVRH